jgi:predicted ATPase
MKLIDLSIRNYRSIESLDLHDFGDVSMFHGNNNTGKSNILSAIRFGIYGSGERYDRIHFGDHSFHQEATYDIFRNDPRKTAEVEVLLLLEDFDRAVIERTLALERPTGFTSTVFSTRSMRDAEIMTLRRTMSMDDQGVKITTDEASIDGNDFRNVKFDARNVVGKALPTLFTPLLEGAFQGISAFRKFTRETDQPNFAITSHSWIPGENMKKALFTLSHSKDSMDRRNFEEIRDTFSSEPFSYGEISVIRSQSPSEPGKLEIMVDLGGFEVPIEHLGSGPQQVLMLLTNTLRRKGHIVAVEEPECNLSPASQRDFVRKLLEYVEVPNSPIGQLLISTHSPIFGYEGTMYSVTHAGGKTRVKKVESEEDEESMDEHFEPTWTWKELRGLRRDQDKGRAPETLEDE